MCRNVTHRLARQSTTSAKDHRRTTAASGRDASDMRSAVAVQRASSTLARMIVDRFIYVPGPIRDRSGSRYCASHNLHLLTVENTGRAQRSSVVPLCHRARRAVQTRWTSPRGAIDNAALRMSVAPTFSVVIPIFNEAESIGELLAGIDAVMARLCQSYEVVAVDDGSADRTLETLKQLATRDRRIRIYSFRRNLRSEEHTSELQSLRH